MHFKYSGVHLPSINDSFIICILLSVVSDDACFEFVSKNKFVSQYCFSTNWLVKGWISKR